MDVQSKLARWLDIVSVSDEKLFWIQRANCWVSGDRAYWDQVYTKCGDKFLPAAIDLVKPKLIVTLGGMASGYFYDFRTLKELMERCLERGPKPDKSHHSYDVFPFYHPAGRAEKWRLANIDLHHKMESLARAKIRESD
jgi:uracil-DNA glycosylase